ncbi:MAG: crossover junction endodeoxyribonuclease RuvC [Minisyncoccota bacterium]
MIILGIDPGTTRIGFGIISEEGGKLKLIDYGVIEGRSKQEISVCILENCKKLSKLIKKYKPEVAGIEKIFFSKNIKTGIDVAQSRGALILELAKAGIKIRELSPSEIKSSVTGYGLADKKSVSKVAAMILGIKDGLKGYDDASDAVAIAIATIFTKSFGE